MANKPLKSLTFPGLSDTYTVPQIDSTLAVSGAAGDAKKTGDEITELKQEFINVSGQLDDILDTPTTNGTYMLQATVTDGVVSYEWVSA